MSARGARAAAAVGWAGAAAVTVRGVGGAVQMTQSLAWLSAAAPRPRTTVGDVAAVRFALVLPLLREQAVIEESVAYFEKMLAAWPKAVLLVVTTAREDAERAEARQRVEALAQAVADGTAPAQVAARFAGVLPREQLTALAEELSGHPYEACRDQVGRAFAALPTTAALAEELCGQAQARGTDVRHLHYPHTEGAMAHQVNYAAAQFLDNVAPGERGRWWIGLYNADSRPHPNTLAAVAARAADPAARIVQQSALFTGTLAGMPPGPGGTVAAGAALLQSRWTLAREIPRLRRQAAAARAGARPHLAHCVGHGLFVRGDQWAAWSGLPVETMNEDLAAGFLACAAGVPIDPLPVLETGDSPTSPRALISQQSQWFWSYVQYPAMGRLAANRSLGTRAVRWRLAASGVGRGVLWLGQSPAVAATLALPLLHRRAGGSARSCALAALISAAAVGTYAVLPARLLATRAQADGETASGVWRRATAGTLPAALLFSAGPWHCLARAAYCRLSGRQTRHGKTER